MLGQTEYHNVSGTRCATDFVELPSILMEHFCSSTPILSSFAKHHSTGKALPNELIQRHQASMHLLKGVEQNSQITMALLDQVYHSAAPVDQAGWSSTAAWYDVAEKCGMPGLRGTGTSWQGRFTHLFGYGASYYSYLFDRAVASRVWAQIFDGGNELSREAGERYQKEVLQWGGSKEPWECVAGLLDNEAIRDGGSRAMAEVGRWGIDN